MINPMDLTGKTYLVTGASAGMGKTVCIILSQLGAKVVLISRNESRLFETRRVMDNIELHKVVPFDLNKLADIEDMIKTIAVETGKFDGFVHCAGLGTTKPLQATTPDFMDEMMKVNVYAFIEITRCITKKKYCNPNMSIVVISSAASVRGDKAKTAYCASKGALDSAVQALAAELGMTKKFRVNSVNPGWVNTDMYKAYVEATGDVKAKEIEERQFMGVSEPSDIANVIAFLLSDASKMITGQSIFVDGGITVW